MIALLLSALLASNGTGKTLVRSQPGTLVASPLSPFVLSLPGESVHVYWRGTLIDKGGTAWSQNGTVPQVAASGTLPAGAGPMSNVNFYATTSASDPMDTAGDFAACILISTANVTTTQQLAVDGVSTGNGWSLYISAGNALFYTYASGAGTGVSTAISVGTNLICYGREGTVTRIKVNLAAISVGAGAKQAADTTNAARLGVYTSGAAAFAGRLHEFVFSTAAVPNDATFTAVGTRAKARLGTAW